MVLPRNWKLTFCFIPSCNKIIFGFKIIWSCEGRSDNVTEFMWLIPSLNIRNQDIMGDLGIIFVLCFWSGSPWQLHAVSSQKLRIHSESTDPHQAYAFWSKPLGLGRSKVTVPVEPVPWPVVSTSWKFHSNSFITFCYFADKQTDRQTNANCHITIRR